MKKTTKNTLILGAALLISSASAMAAQPVVPAATLQGMGLGQMRPMSDDDGLAVRGKGTSASVWGSSQARWAGPSNLGGQSSSNNYSASSSWLGKSSGAVGSSFSYAGKFQGFGQFGR